MRNYTCAVKTLHVLKKLELNFLENDQLSITLCNILKFFVAEVNALIIVDSGKKMKSFDNFMCP